jgi:hypothetical protein
METNRPPIIKAVESPNKSSNTTPVSLRVPKAVEKVSIARINYPPSWSSVKRVKRIRLRTRHISEYY